MGASDVGFHRRVFCVTPLGDTPITNRAIATRSVSVVLGIRSRGVVPVHAITYGTSCYRSKVRDLQRTPTWLASAMQNAPLPTTVQAGLHVIVWNMGGASKKVDWIGSMTRALEPDLWLLHEVWDPPILRNAFPTEYQQIVGSYVGQGQGFVMAYKRSLVCNDRQPKVQADFSQWQTVLFPDTGVGRLLVTNVHLSPHLSFKEKKSHLENMDTVKRMVQPDSVIVGGDFNMTDQGSATALALQRRPNKCFVAYESALPAGTVTNVTFQHGVRRETNIDHVYSCGMLGSPQGVLLPTLSTHFPINVMFSSPGATRSPYHWTTVRWRQAEPEHIYATAKALDVVWGLLQFYPTPPAAYLRMLETVALQCLPRKMSKEEILGRIDRHQRTHGAEELSAMRTRIEEAAAASKTRIKATLLGDLSITSATKGALSCPKPRMRPYSGICPSPGMVPRTAEERMLEVTKQATVSTRLRFVNLDIDWLTAHANLSRSGLPTLNIGRICQCRSSNVSTGWA